MIRFAFLFVLFTVFGCTKPPLPETPTAFVIPASPPGTCGYGRHVRHSFHADTAFTAAEAAAIEGAATDWYAFSNGRIDFQVAFDLDRVEHNSEPQVLKVYSTDDDVRELDAGDPEFKIFGWALNGRVHLVIDRVPPDKLRILAAHEFGHVAALRWPNCKSALQYCEHSPDDEALMAMNFSGNPLGDADLAFCRASCLCE